MALDPNFESPARERKYRPAVPLSSEIASHCHIYFDEKLYHSALNLLTALAISGTSHPDALTIPALAPLPIHIEAASILLVHPQYTTHSPQNERVELASRSISCLRSILSNLGPLNANLAEAFSLAPLRSRARRRYGGDEASSDDDEETAKLKGIIMNKGRIRACAMDFWHIVGWVFNCSVVYRKRWKYWKVWLDYMLDVLDADWNEREARDIEDLMSEDDFKLRRGSLLVKYLSGTKGRSSAMKRAVGSIFADGGVDDLRAYPEIFDNETLEVKAQNGQKRKREDYPETKFGDYNDEDEDVEFDSETPALSQETDDDSGPAAPDPWMGGSESIALRQRVLAFLSRIAHFLPEEFVGIRELYEELVSNMRQLPLPAFSLLISPSDSSQLRQDVFVSLATSILNRLIPLSAPRPQAVSGGNSDGVSQVILERCYLQFPANTSSTDDNAKVSILVESLFRKLLRFSRVEYSTSLDAAVETGILARENKCKIDKRRRGHGATKTEENDDREWLNASGERLRSMVAWTKQHIYFDES